MYHDDNTRIPDMNPLCATEDPDLWFSSSPADQAEAQAICSVCPFQPECRALADKHVHGVWGGIVRGRTDKALLPPVVCARPGCDETFPDQKGKRFCSRSCSNSKTPKRQMVDA